jgi:circadian clock protein KaiB
MRTPIMRKEFNPDYRAVDRAPDNEQQQEAPNDGRYVLRLFVAGDRPQSLQAKKSIEQICESYMPGRYELTVFDVCKDFTTAQNHGVLLTPTLLLLSPLPRVTIIGNLSDTEKVLFALRLSEHRG